MDEDTLEEDERERQLSNIVYTPFSPEKPCPLPSFTLRGAPADSAAALRHVMSRRGIRPKSRFGTLLLMTASQDIVCDAFWWVYLRYYLAPRPAGQHDVPAVAPPSLPGVRLPLHVYSRKTPCMTRSLALLDRVSAPGTHHDGMSLDGGSVDSPRSGAADSGTCSPRSEGSCSSLVGCSEDVTAAHLQTLPLMDREVFVESEEKDLFDRIAKNYVAVAHAIFRMPVGVQDMQHQLFPSLVSQAVCLVLQRLTGAPLAHAIKQEVRGVFSYWMSGVQRNRSVGSPCSPRAPAGQKRTAYPRKHHAVKREAQDATPKPSEKCAETALSELKQELVAIQASSKSTLQRKMRGFQRLHGLLDGSESLDEPPDPTDAQDAVMPPADRGNVVVYGVVKKLRPLPKRVLELLRDGRGKPKRDSPWFEFGRTVRTNRMGDRVLQGNFCTTDCSPLMQHLFLQRLCVKQPTNKPSDMLWAID